MLVDNVYQVFKNDYFPSETVFLRGIDNNNNVSNNSTNNKEHSTKQRGTIREKFNMDKINLLNTLWSD